MIKGDMIHSLTSQSVCISLFTQAIILKTYINSSQEGYKFLIFRDNVVVDGLKKWRRVDCFIQDGNKFQSSAFLMNMISFNNPDHVCR